jgi:hypothetical protein
MKSLEEMAEDLKVFLSVLGPRVVALQLLGTFKFLAAHKPFEQLVSCHKILQNYIHVPSSISLQAASHSSSLHPRST